MLGAAVGRMDAGSSGDRPGACRGEGCYISAMRVRVQSTWRTRLLLLLAILVAGVLALFSMREREEREAARHPAPPPSARGDVIEVELAQ